MAKRTPLYQKHLDSKAKIIDFAGWEMPINYGSQIEEHNSVRKAAGVFDVSHMTVVDVGGHDAENYLRYLLANDVKKLVNMGQALYSAMLNHDGHVVDDLIVYRMSFGFRIVSNCGTREKDLRWMIQNTDGFRVSVEEKPKLAILSVKQVGAYEVLPKKIVLYEWQVNYKKIKPLLGKSKRILFEK